MEDVLKNNAISETRTEGWAARWATAGAAMWVGIAILARIGIMRVGVIELMFLFAPLVIVPLGMELGRVSGGRPEASRRLADVAQVLQPLGAALTVVAMWLPPGKVAALTSLGWLAVCGLMASAGLIELVDILLPGKRRTLGAAGAGMRMVGIAAAIAKLDLAVGGAWLLASRLGMRPLGIQEPIGLLTAVHFHYAGFATAMIASTTLRYAESRRRQRWLPKIIMGVVLLPLVVAAGFVVSPLLKMAAGVAFSASVAVLAGFMWNCARQATEQAARRFLRGAASCVFVAMGLSAAYAIADFVYSDVLPIPRMASTHGVLNGVGFCLWGLLGWLVERHHGPACEQGRLPG